MEVTNTHLKILAISFMCTFVYLYLYIRIDKQNIQIQEAINITMTDFDKVKQIASNIYNRMHDKINEPMVAAEDAAIFETVNEVEDERQNNFTIKRLVEVFGENSTKHPEFPIVTVFTSWVTKPEKYTCHNNTLYNWNSMKPYVQPILFTNEERLRKEAKMKGWTVMPVHATGTKQKVPILKIMFEVAMEISSSTFYAYANGDILFTDTLIHTLLSLANSDIMKDDREQPILIVGRRTNVYNVTKKEAETWFDIQNVTKTRGKLFKADAEDYFITTRDYPWYSLPDVVIGRPAYDNWLVWNAGRLKHLRIDATNTLLALHQTTNKGNDEGHKHGDTQYNVNILKRVYKRIQYGAGLTSSTQLFSNYDEKGDIQFLHRY